MHRGIQKHPYQELISSWEQTLLTLKFSLDEDSRSDKQFSALEVLRKRRHLDQIERKRILVEIHVDSYERWPNRHERIFGPKYLEVVCINLNDIFCADYWMLEVPCDTISALWQWLVARTAASKMCRWRDKMDSYTWKCIEGSRSIHFKSWFRLGSKLCWLWNLARRRFKVR